MNTHHLTKDQVPANLKGGYSGNKFKVEICESITIPSTAGLWDGGSQDHYTFRDINTGDVLMPVLEKLQQSSPWNEARRDHSVTMEPGFVVIRRTIFQGKDLGLTIYCHPGAVDRLKLPAPSELSEHERIILIATRSYKSSYMGRDRYDMATDEMNSRNGFNAANDTPLKYENVPTREEWETAKASLIERKLLNRAGAITVAGRNAIGDARL